MVVFKSDDGRKRTIREYTKKIAKKKQDLLASYDQRFKNSYEIKGKIMMYDGAKFYLSKGQLKWLNKYETIDLSEWRYECLFDMAHPDFIYVGDGHSDINRSANLEVDMEYYWPKEQ
ncbi:MAG: hypothetical protein CMB64_04970 [Euryarchaeota archaeon]|nr:hypothetical protein [Euryarchaeota archaeon]|tara:strand:+ start:2647 stop:2997 length:351 start_codon:yes stop_codon:yes gene_type:complete